MVPGFLQKKNARNKVTTAVMNSSMMDVLGGTGINSMRSGLYEKHLVSISHNDTHENVVCQFF